MAVQSKQLYFQSTQEYPFDSCSNPASSVTIWYDDTETGVDADISEIALNNVLIWQDEQQTILADVGRYSETNWQTFQPVTYYVFQGSHWAFTPLGDLIEGFCQPTYTNPNLRNITVNVKLGTFTVDDIQEFLTSEPVNLWYESEIELTFEEIVIADLSLQILDSPELDPNDENNLGPIQAGFYGPNSNQFIAYQLFDSGEGIQIQWLYKDTEAAELQFQPVESPVNYFNVTSDGIESVYSIDLYAYEFEDSVTFCALPEGSLPNRTLWYSSESGELSFYQIVANQVLLFQTQYSALYYLQNDFIIPPNGITGTDINTGVLYNSWVSDQLSSNYLMITSWFANSPDGIVLASPENITSFPCTDSGGGLETVYSIEIWERDADTLSISDFCFTQKNSVVAYYKSQNELTLQQIVSLGVSIYKTQAGAQSSIPHLLYETNAYSDNYTSYWIFVNDSNGNYWQGLDDLTSNDVLYPNLLSAIECEAISTPSPEDYEIYTTVPADLFRTYYAFQSCAPNSNGDYLIYVIDSLHANDGSSSYVSDFIDYMNLNDFVTFNSDEGSIEQIVCKTLIHKVNAISPNDAVDTLNTLYPLGLIQYVNASILGIISESSVNLYDGCETCINPEGSEDQYTFPFISDSDNIFVVEPRTDLESNYKLDDVSKPLLRTNPKLSTNIKLVVNEDDEIYLESINATKDLSSSKYKRYRVSSASRYAYDISRFYNENATPYDMAYTVKREWSDLSVLDDYEKQFEEEYHYGTRLNYSKLHSEKFRIFAPIWLDLNVPKKFVIYRVNDPLPKETYTDNATDKFKRIMSLLKNATLIKSFDLTRNSEIGKYLRNHSQDEFFPASPMTVSFEKTEKTLWCGIDLVKGGFTKKGEYIYKDFIETDKPLIEANDFITDGWRRNNMVNANLINLEFLFDDFNASDYSVNRYFGLYVDDIPSGQGEVSTLKNGIIRFSNMDSLLDSTNPFDAIPSYQMTSRMPVLGYIKSNTSIHNIKNSVYYDSSKGFLSVDNNGVDLSEFKGIKRKGVSAELTKRPGAGNDFVKLEVNAIPNAGDKLSVIEVKKQSFRFNLIDYSSNSTLSIVSQSGDDAVTWSSGSTINEMFENLLNSLESTLFAERFTVNISDSSIYVTEKESGFADNNIQISTLSGSSVTFNRKEIYSTPRLDSFVYRASSNISKGRFEGKYFSNQGSISDIASAITGVINANSRLRATAFKNTIYISHYSPGFERLSSTVMLGKNNNPESIVSGASDESNRLRIKNNILTNWQPLILSGGHSDGHSCYISEESLEAVQIGDMINSKRANSYNKVLGIFQDWNDLKLSRSYLILSKPFDLKPGEVELFAEYKSEVGLFSAYDMYDMNFDTYDTSNSELRELKYEVLKSSNCDQPEAGYFEYGPGEMLCQVLCGGTDSIGFDDIDPSLYVDPNICKSPRENFSALLSVLDPETVEGSTSEYIASEFDRLEENNTKEFATLNRVVPFINKWSMKDTVNARELPYFLNVNEAFGRTNMSSDITKEGRDPLWFSHEWFYMDNLPTYFNYLMVNDSFSYINFIKGYEITRDQFINVETDYFNIWTWNDGFEVNHSINNVGFKVFSRKKVQKKYSRVIGGNSNAFASTVFRGLRFIFKKRKEFVNTKAYEFVKDSEFNGYKFTTITRVNANSDNNLIDFEVIQNKKFKTLTLIVDLQLNENNTESWLNRNLLYNLNSRLEPNGDSYIFSNMPLSGAIMLSNIDENQGGPYEINGFTHINGSNPSFTTQIVAGIDGSYGDIKITYEGIGEYYLQVISISDDDTLVVSGLPVNAQGEPISAIYLSIGAQASAKYEYVGGGLNGHQAVLNALSAKNVAELFNLNDNSVNYTTVNPDGTILRNQFIMNIDDGKEVIVRSNLTKEIDQDAPQSYKLFQGNIGYNITERQEYFSFLIRHNGNYTVDLKPVVTFTDIYTHHKIKKNFYSADPTVYTFVNDLYKSNINQINEIDLSLAWYKRYNRLGVAFNVGFIKDIGGTHDSDWAMIKNHHFHKVNDINTTGVIKLTESGEYLPLYPLINEIAIDKKDVNVFKSSWEPGYYTRSLAGGENVETPGTLSTAEEKSYLGSTQIKILEAYDIFNFTQQSVNTETELDEILRNESNESDIVWFENDQQIIADFYLLGSIQKKLSQEGVLAAIQRYVAPDQSYQDKTTLEDDALDYVYRNLINLFTIDNIDLYTVKKKGVASQFESVAAISLADNGGYALDKNFTYTLHSNLPINFRLIYNKMVGYSYWIRPVIKIQS